MAGVRKVEGEVMTLASEISSVSDWCQRWQERRHSFRHHSEDLFDPRRYEVAAVGETAAKAFVEQHHYSRAYPASRLRYGLWHKGGILVGVAVLSVPVQKAVLTKAFPALQPYVESLELGRFVLLDEVPANAESWFLARCFRLAAADGVRGIVSFADPVARRDAAGSLVFPGHLGIIYQASNAVYSGRGTARQLTLLPDGSVLNNRSLSKVRNLERGHEYVEATLCRFGASPRLGKEPRVWIREAFAAIGVRQLWHPGNHRYLFRVGPRRHGVVVSVPSLPYPKARDVQLADTG